jgi:hypothetical protein
MESGSKGKQNREKTLRGPVIIMSGGTKHTHTHTKVRSIR